MKKSYFIVFIALVTLALPGKSQELSHHELVKLDTKIELLLDSAAKHMVLFILTKEVKEYDAGLARVNEADSLNNFYISAHHVSKLDQNDIDSRKEEMAEYRKEGLKSIVMQEADKDRKIKVKFQHKEYKVGKKTRELFDQFSAYIPKN